jgi:RimJ/RimL family protein N-acetyltransferase
MCKSQSNLDSWLAALLPGPVTLAGHWARLEPLSAVRHGRELWEAVCGHDELWTWMGDGPYSTYQSFLSAIESKEVGAAARFFAIVPAASVRAVGYASLMRMDPANGVIEVGNVLFSPSLQRTPAATETLFLLARYIFEDLRYRRFEWKCNALNQPSRRAAERLGFTFEGIFRQHMIVKGSNRDTAWFAMLDGEWPQCKRAFETWLDPDNFDADGRQKQTLASCR